MDKNFSIKITGGGYNIDDKINKLQLGRILSIVTSDDNIPNTVFSSNDQPIIKNHPKRHAKPNFSTPVSVRKEIQNMNLDPFSSSYGNYWDMKTKSDRIMWILAVLNENKFEFVNQKEISSIAQKLGDNIPTKYITPLLDTHKKRSRIAPSLDGTIRTVRILKPGLDYVKNSQSKSVG